MELSLGQIFLKLLTQKVMLKVCLLRENEQDTSQNRYILRDILAGNQVTFIW